MLCNYLRKCKSSIIDAFLCAFLANFERNPIPSDRSPTPHQRKPFVCCYFTDSKQIENLPFPAWNHHRDICNHLGLFDCRFFGKNIRDSVSQLGDNVVYVQKWPWGGGGEYAWWKYLNRPVPLSKESDLLRKRSQYAENVAFGTSSGGATAKRNGMDAGGVEVLGVTFEYNQIWDFELEEGRYFTETEMYGGKPYCIIGANIAEGLFPGGESPIGEQITIRGQKWVVIGVFEKVGESLVGQSYDKMVLVPFKFVRTVVNTDRNDGNLIMVSAKEGITLAQLKDELTGLMRSIRRLRPGADDNFALNDPSLISNQLDGLFGVLGLVGPLLVVFLFWLAALGLPTLCS